MKIICNQIFNVPVGVVEFGQSSTIAGQDYDIGELLQRWSQGQRLNIHMRPLDIEDDAHPSDTEDTELMPQFEDIVELKEFEEQNNARKTALIERVKQAKAAKEKEQQQHEVEPHASQDA